MRMTTPLKFISTLERSGLLLSGARALGLAGVLAFAPHASALAQAAYPSRPVTLVLSTAPSGIADAVARILQPAFAKDLGQPVVIDNRPGAAGVVGTVSAAKARPDGQTVLLNLEMQVINDLTTAAKPPYDSLRDFLPVSLLVRLPNMIAVSSALKVSNLREFIALAQSKPGAMNFGSPGILTSSYLATEEFLTRTGIKMTHVPYGGGPQVVQALMRNEIQFAFLSRPPLLGGITSGLVTPLVVTGERRMKEEPDVPTMIESGFPGFVFHSWIGACVPAKTPDAVVKRLNAAFVTALADPETRSRLAATGFEPVASTPEEFATVLKAEHEHWSNIVKDHHIRLD